jgi:CdiI N-terminal domain
MIGDFTETFVVPLGFWGEADYRASWRRAFEVLEGDPCAVSCLMASMTDPVTSNFLICWPMYREGEDVYVQNAIVLLDEIEGPFDPGAPWGSLGPRRGMDDDKKGSLSGHVHGVTEGVLRVSDSPERAGAVLATSGFDAGVRVDAYCGFRVLHL